MKIFVKKSRFFDLKNFRRPISKFSNYGSNKPFRLKFCAKLCRIQRRRPWNQNQGEWRAWEASAKKRTPYKKKDTFRKVCPETIRFGFRNLASLPYIFVNLGGYAAPHTRTSRGLRPTLTGLPALAAPSCP